MCGLCGTFGVGPHWTDGAEGPVGLAEQRHRGRIANLVLGLFGLTLQGWANRYTLRSGTGRVAIVDHLGAVWPEAERLAGRTCDPLDPDVIAAVEARAPPANST